VHAAASAASARHTQQLKEQRKTHEEQLSNERAHWRLQVSSYHTTGRDEKGTKRCLRNVFER